MQDSIGKVVTDTLGPKAVFKANGFSYVDHMNNVQTWYPKPNIPDTLVIEYYEDFIELSTNNFYTSIPETFLVEKGDTVVFNYKNQIPKARIVNREVNAIELNYNSYRMNKLFGNKYSSHYLVFGNLFLTRDLENSDQNSVDYYLQAKIDYLRETALLDSLLKAEIISEENYKYRFVALNMLMEKHKKLKPISQWLEANKSLRNDENIEQPYTFDLAHTDSLLKFSFFRDYLQNISLYNLDLIQESNSSSGAFYIDSRIRFDSIVMDERFNQTAKNFLLFEAYKEIGQNFSVSDKEEYFRELQKHTTNAAELDKLQKAYNLDFSKSDVLILTSLANDTIYYSDLLNKNNGKWLFVDFWASWCKPCLELLPVSINLQNELKEYDIEFVYLSLNDNKENWSRTIEKFGISKNECLFIENGNVSKVIEDLGIKSIPHYLIYDPSGNLVNGFADRPGQGAKEQLKKLIQDYH